MARWFMRRYRPPRKLRTRVLLGLGKALLALVFASVLVTFALRWVDPPTSAFMVRSSLSRDSNGRSNGPLRHYWVDWVDISAHAKLAVVAAEDQRFASHSGFDLESIADAAYERVTQGRSRGASTISQQVAKNLYLWPGQSFVRKGLEAYHTALIELLWPKRRILEVYLNVAQFGERVFGIEAASITYFGKASSRLTPREAALLAALLPSPRRYRLSPEPSPYLESRSRWILTQMDMLGGEAYLNRL
ncbi:MAG TPA: monofunctional biosynthetic peptidoglycan transglycosylase [Myxococcota bacterium]